MLVALSPSIHRLRMPSLDYHGDSISSPEEVRTKSVAESGVASSEKHYMAATSAKGRPKLSLETISLPSPYAKSSKGVLGSASVLSGTSTPTTSNTIVNSVPLRPSPSTPRSPFSRLLESRPYNQPLGLHSILKNAPQSPKLGIKRSHSLFSADSGSPHTTRRIFFPAVKKVKFEPDEKLAIDIPFKEQHASPEASYRQDETEKPLPNEKTSEDESSDRVEPDLSAVTAAPIVNAASRRRNSTPPPKIVSSKKRRKVRNWQWTITSPGSPKPDEER